MAGLQHKDGRSILRWHEDTPNHRGNREVFNRAIPIYGYIEEPTTNEPTNHLPELSHLQALPSRLSSHGPQLPFLTRPNTTLAI